MLKAFADFLMTVLLNIGYDGIGEIANYFFKNIENKFENAFRKGTSKSICWSKAESFYDV